MKRISTALLFFALILPCPATAQEHATIALSAPAGLVQKACPVPAWKYGAVVWKGVVDKRSTPEVGLQIQKNKEPLPVFSSPPIADAFNLALGELLPACGMTLASAGSADSLTVSAELREFYTGVEKKFFTGKSESRASIVFNARRGNSSSSVTVGCELEAKKVRSGNIKQLEKAVNELFSELLKQIPATPEMAELK